MNDIKPFSLHVPQADLDDLHDRLTRTRWPDELPDAGTDYGIPLARVRGLATAWAALDWRAHEAALNAYPQYVTHIDGQRVHFLHVRSTTPDAWAGPDTRIPDDVILTDVMHYWLTGTAGSSARLVKESGRPPQSCPAPLGVAVLPHDIVQSIRPLVELHHDVRRWTEDPRGGHFAALEVPGLLAADITAFFEALPPRA